MRTLFIATLVAVAAPVTAAADDCREALSGIESASRSAQEALLVARARGEEPELSAQMTALRDGMADLRADCGELAARPPAENGGADPADRLRENGADGEQDAPKGSKRLDRSKRGF